MGGKADNIDSEMLRVHDSHNKPSGAESWSRVYACEKANQKTWAVLPTSQVELL